MKRLSTSTRPRSARLGVALGVAGLAGVLALSACSSSGDAATSATGAPSTAAAGAPVAGAPGGGGVSGEIAAISGSTLQVQDTDSQTAVTYTADTAITRTVEAALADVTSGVCVTAFTGGMPASDGATDDSADDSGAATSVIISAAVDGDCAAGAFPGGGSGFGGGAPPTDLPEGMTPPTDMPEGMTPPTDIPDGAMPTGAPGAGGFGGLTTGLVTAVSGTGFTVQATDAEGTASTEDVTVDDSTTFTRTETTDASSLVVGACVTAMGEADDKGTVTATTLAVSAAGDDGCSTGFGRPGAGGGRGPAGSATTGSGS
ncbi:DUF5666 domain-containing protein [Herbiconiux ginsengi]|uniref:Uncharacterized protein n=1 Tax=Herbiconiux ginsengi TaxID=381665 RepID=A0A1H3N3R0_9MICO|nr:DUF5666 domain-containing protein [Herbiconiux ginsengi]SDY83476.1 hypothetical protein SAMN05216554_1680 [Herbiconiux ginsengi]